MSTAWPDYELIDFGDGRKLERFGAGVFDRPAPAAAGVKKRRPGEWAQRTSRYNGDRVGGGRWEPDVTDGRCELERAPWCRVPVGDGFQMFVAPRPEGQLGIFPEQFANWQWIADRVRRCETPPRVLNLFAYTGGSTLAAAAAGAAVAHVDAAKPSIERASFNAEGSGLAERPIRWIIEDAMKFCRREAKRGNRYDAVILDPPTYGHGPKGEEWIVKRDLLPLLALCGELTERRPKFAAALLPFAGPGAGGAVGVLQRGPVRRVRPTAADGRAVPGNGRRTPLAERMLRAVAWIVAVYSASCRQAIIAAGGSRDL